MKLSDEIINAARDVIGTPFKHQGRLPGIALDCAGVIVHVLESVGVPYNDLYGYSRLPHNGRLKAALDSQSSLIRVSNFEPGDVLLMRFGKEPTHLAIFAGSTIIHAYELVEKVCEHRWPDGKIHLVQSYRIVRPNRE